MFRKTSASQRVHHGLARNDAGVWLTVFGALVGCLAGVIVNLFRFVLELPFTATKSGSAGDFEALPGLWHFALPVCGSLILVLLYWLTPNDIHRTGVSHVIDKVQNMKGRMIKRNAIFQFVGAAVSLMTGHSCGREGPAIHMGAASGSTLGQFFNLPNNASRTLIACGSAAAISASFNTPLAGVIFAMEVIMMEYSVATFLPIIISAVSGAIITWIFYGNSPVFQIETLQLNTVFELPFIIIMGCAVGVIAGAFIQIHKYCLSFNGIDIKKRLLVAGLLAGITAFLIPQVMGTGYDTLNEALTSTLSWDFLLILLAAKLLLTAITLGLGIPGGLIGPTLVIGGILGALLATVGTPLLPEQSTSTGFYVLLGMCAMMGAVLRAPLAALLATMELSQNPNLLLPAMLIIVISSLITTEVFGLESIYQINLRMSGIKTPNNMSRLLHRYGASSIMKTGFTLYSDPAKSDPTSADFHIFRVEHKDREKEKLKEKQTLYLLPAETLQGLVKDGTLPASEEIMNKGKRMVEIPLHATLQEAMDLMEQSQVFHGAIISPLGLGQQNILGFLSTDDIIAFYRDR